jgi:cytidylate kinase
MGSGGETIAVMVAKELNYELYDDDKLQKIAIEIGLHHEEAVRLDEKTPGLLDRMLSNKPELYLDYMESVIFEVARNGEGVIIGHGSQMLLRDFSCAFHVRIHASQSTGIQNLMEKQGLRRDVAEKLIHKFDHRQSGFFRYAFNLQWDDPSLYDVVINTKKMSVSTAAKLILETVQSEDINTCSLDAVEAMEKLSLQKQIHAELLKNNIEIHS